MGDNSKIKYDTIAGDGNVMNDFVIDYRWDGGVSGSQYIKFSGGLFIQWGYETKTINHSSTWGSLYYGQFGTVVYPHAFRQTPYFLVYAGDEHTSFFAKNNAGASTTQSVRVDSYRPVSGSAKIQMSWIAIGKWK